MKYLLVLLWLPLQALALSDEAALQLFNRARGGDAAAVAELRSAAESGDAPGQFQLGRAYSHGSPVLPRDDAVAARFVEKAAAQGHPEAQSNLGYLYSVGMGVEKSSEQAISWWTRAAEAGYVQAQFNLALAYVQGQLAAKDEAKALAWARKAAAQRNTRAIALYDELCRRNAALCKGDPPPSYFVFEMATPKLRILIPDAPAMKMDAGLRGQAPGGYSLSVLVPTADAGMTPVDCARSSSTALARNYGLKREDVVARRTSETTFVMLFPVRIPPIVQLKAYLLSGHGGTHCIEVHLSKVVASEAEVHAWFSGFEGARIEALP